MVTFGEKYVERTEKALVETVILEHCRSMPMTIDQCWQKIQPLGFDSKVDRDFVASCYKKLERDGHLKEENGRYNITEDGREDIQKVSSILQNVVGQFNGGQGLRTVGSNVGTNVGPTAGRNL